MAESPPEQSAPDVLVILLPLLVVLSTLLFLLLLFLISILCLRRRRGISLRDNDGPVDLSRDHLMDGEGGFDGVESRWLESVSELTRREYLRAKGQDIPHLSATKPTNSFTCPFNQTINSSIPPTPSPQTSHYPSFSQFKRRACLPGVSSRMSKQSIHSLYTHAPRSPSFPTQHQPHACSLIYHCPN